MDVKAFIFEATDKSLKIDAAIKEVEAAKEAVEAARAAVEAGKAGVEAAKQGVVAAKEELDTYAERAEEFGLTRSKFKDAVERMKTLLTDIGAVEGSTESTEAAAVEPKQKAPRKRKGQETTEQTTEQAPQHGEGELLADMATRIANNRAVTEKLPSSETEAGALTTTDEILVAELTDPVSIAAASAAAAVGHVEWSSVDQAVATVDEPSIAAEDDVVVEAPVEAPAAATAEIEAIANILRREPETVVVAEIKDETVIAEVAKAVEAHTTATTATEAEEVEDELDNSVAEQELLDFVDEVGTSDNDVKAVLSAAIKVVSWHTTNVAKAALRTQPSPLALAGVLVVEDAGYAPKDIQDAYKVALSFGGEKLAAAISWFNKSLDLLADAKPVEDFRFSEPVKAPRAKKEEPAVEPTPAPEEAAVTVVETQDSVSNDALDEVIDATEAGSDVAETIEDMQLFSAPEADEEAAEAPEVAKPEEKPAASLPPKVSKPSWLK